MFGRIERWSAPECQCLHKENGTGKSEPIYSQFSKESATSRLGSSLFRLPNTFGLSP